MSISPSIVSFTEALDATRAELAAVNGKVAELEADRRTVVAAPPHSDDIAATFLAWLKAASASFTAQLAARLTDTFVKDADAAASAAPGKTSDLLRLEAAKPDRETLITRSMQNLEPALNSAAIAYFLRDLIAEQIPALVDRLCPEARTGLKAADRQAALAAIDAQLVTLRAEAVRLNGDLTAARVAVTRH